VLCRWGLFVCARQGAWRASITLYLCQHYSGEKLRDIGGHFGLGDSGVTKASFRLRKKMASDPALREMVAKIAHSLGFVQTPQNPKKVAGYSPRRIR
jgi:hypothetical protein